MNPATSTSTLRWLILGITLLALGCGPWIDHRLRVDDSDLSRDVAASPQFKVGDALTLVVSGSAERMAIVVVETETPDRFRFQGKRTVYRNGSARTTEVSGVVVAADVRDRTVQSSQVIGLAAMSTNLPGQVDKDWIRFEEASP